jgi:hypothetical protein
MSYTSRGTSEVVLAGLQKSMITVDVDRGQVLNEVRIFPFEDVLC